jgi:hypothetical protein
VDARSRGRHGGFKVTLLKPAKWDVTPALALQA